MGGQKLWGRCALSKVRLCAAGIQKVHIFSIAAGCVVEDSVMTINTYDIGELLL
jgi:hypothetical protein